MNFEALNNEPRLLMQVALKPLQGTRFQPTGFPDLGAADYQTHEGVRMLLVESAQSMANRLEAVCWDESKNDWVGPLSGLPYVAVYNEKEDFITNSVFEAHRLNSPYILEGKGKDKAFFKATLAEELGDFAQGRVNLHLLSKALFKYDANALLHGIFLEKLAGRLRLPRVLSAFIEADHVEVVPCGGVKLDAVNPRSSDTNKGYGNVPFHRDEYTGLITAYFNIDLAQIRGFRLGKAAEQLLITLALFKVQKLLHTCLRLRTACDLGLAGELQVQKPNGWKVPSLTEIEKALPELIKAATPLFASPPVTPVTYTEGKTKKAE